MLRRTADCGLRTNGQVRVRPVTVIVVLAIATACAKKPESAPAPASTSVAGAPNRCVAVRERLAKYPALMVEQEPSRLSGSFPKISPARRDTSFTVSFTVNMTGKPVMSSFSVSKHVGTRFSTELKKSVALWRYSPATLEGCPVARKVSHTIDTRASRPRTGLHSSPQSAVRS